ncbi:hypothetical protein D1872_308800 [compost metagenome]
MLFPILRGWLGSTSEPIGEAGIRPVNEPMTKGDRNPNVTSSKSTGECDLSTIAQIDKDSDEQDEINQRCDEQQQSA